MNATPLPHNKMTACKKILIVAGEASGDMLAANLIKSLRLQNPDIYCYGMGSQQMREAGAEIKIDADELSVMGILDVLMKFRKIRAAMAQIKQMLIHNPPDLVILVDYPGFNLRMAKASKQAGIKVLYYVSPQIWAWRKHRIHHIKKYVDHMAVLLLFEKAIYERADVPVTFVGHPLLDSSQPTMSKEAVFERYHIDPNRPIIGLLPGSRKKEITRLLPIMMDAVELIKQRIPDAQFVLPLAPSLQRDDVKPYIDASIFLIENNTHNALPLCDAAITVSGTATLEVALNQVPMIIIYKMDTVGYWAGKCLVKLSGADLPHIGLCNIVAETEVAKELLQKKVNATAIADEIVQLVKDKTYRTQIIDKMSVIKPNLGERGGSDNAARVALEMLLTSSSTASDSPFFASNSSSSTTHSSSSAVNSSSSVANSSSSAKAEDPGKHP